MKRLGCLIFTFSANASFFDVFIESTLSPPDSVALNVTEAGGQGFVQSFKLNNQSSFHTLYASVINGGTQGKVEIDPQSMEMLPDNFFDVLLEMSALPGQTDPILVNSPVLQFGGGPATFFDVFFELCVQGGTEQVQMHFEVPSGQWVVFDDIILDYSGASSFFDIFLIVNAPNGGMLQTDLPFIQMTMASTFVPVPEPMTISLFIFGIAGICRRR